MHKDDFRVREQLRPVLLLHPRGRGASEEAAGCRQGAQQGTEHVLIY